MIQTHELNYNYTDAELKAELENVFDSVFFIDAKTKDNLRKSYLMNFGCLVKYARANNIDEMEYIRSIRKCLLSCPRTYDTR